MSSMEEVLGARATATRRPPRWPGWHAHLNGSDLGWSLAFLLPYAALFAAFVVYPMAYGLWMGSDPRLYAELLADPRYVRTATNTLVFVGLAVNLEMLLAFLLAGFFSRRRRWIKALLVVFLLPWTLPAVPAFLSFHWMLVAYQEGLIDRLLWALFGIEGPFWLGQGWLALACDIVAVIWKWLPLWTLVFLAGRMAIPQELYESAAVDGASSFERFRHITLPLLRSLYVISSLIAAIWAFSDFTPVFFVSGGGPAFSSEVVATLAVHYALDFAHPELAVAAGLSTLLALAPLVILLLRRLKATEVLL